MKTCANCAASNMDAADFCSECGAALGTLPRRTPVPGASAAPKAPEYRPSESPTMRGDYPAAREPGPTDTARRILLPTMMPKTPGAGGGGGGGTGELDAERLASTLTSRLGNLSALQKKHSADIMFILDCTESMKGELQAIKDAIFSFVDTIRSDGVRVRIGLIEFRDRLNREEHRVLHFNGETFTSDPEVFKREVAALRAIGGGDEPESSLDAVLLALRQPFDREAQKVLVLVTDAPPHIPDLEARGVEEVAASIRAAGISQLYLVIPVQDAKNQIYLKLCEGTRSLAFDLGEGDDFNRRAEDFKRTLMSLGKTISAATR